MAKNRMRVKVTRVFIQEQVMDPEIYNLSKLYTKEEITEYETTEADAITTLVESDGSDITTLSTVVEFVYSDPDSILQDTEEDEEEIGDGDNDTPGELAF
jgi:hypothetical protein